MAATPADLALSLLAGEVLRRAATVLRPAGIPVMPLKGVLWQRTLHAGHSRPISDVDVLVPEDAFDDARGALRRAGFVPHPNPQGPHEQQFSAPDFPLELDLHRTLFARGRYRLESAGLFARSTRDEALFGVEIALPHPLDQMAHLLGHLATDHSPGDDLYRADFRRLIEVHRLEPEVVAAHLGAHGLARAARFALPELASPSVQPWAQRCQAALGTDPLGDMIARATRAVVARRGRFSPLSSLLGHGLNASLPRAAQSVAWALAARLRASRL